MFFYHHHLGNFQKERMENMYYSSVVICFHKQQASAFSEKALMTPQDATC